MRLFLLIFLFSLRSHAIVDVESLRMKLHDSPYGGQASLSWSRKQGNSDTNQFSAGLQGLWKHDEVEYLAALSREFGESNGASDTNRTVGHVRVTYPYGRVYQAEAFGQVEQDQFRRLADRELAGTGVRIALSADKEFLAYLGAGAMWTKETIAFASAATDAGSREVFRGDMYVSLRKQVATGVDFTTAAYYQPALAHLDDTWVFDTNQLTFEANESMSLALVYQLTYDSQPPQTVKSTDQTFGSVLKYKF